MCGVNVLESELEGGLDQAAEVVEAFAVGLLQIAQGGAEVIDSGSHADVVGDLHLVPPFPGVVAVVGANIGVVAVAAAAGDEGGLAKGEAEANAEQKAALASGRILVKDASADIALQQVLTRPDDFDVIATLNLNGDYLSDALAAQVGGIGIAPGGNINYVSGHAIFEATHGTAPKYDNLDKVNPCSVVLSGDMMLRHMGWSEAADMIVDAIERTIGDKVVTYDFARLMDGATEVKTSEFADAVIANMR